MADNLNITSGSGIVIKTDEIGGVHYQLPLAVGKSEAGGIFGGSILTVF
jgi:hypothetical protein